ncbi:hypothetical protein QMK34_26465 [Amycolatopsis sp. H20-H5]|nr:hypothetical protein [Amycolatopsis sp. H20-H5]MEC3978818.1 hypothetical protein [Amycolatopsis sp. H20-H5]
MAFAGGVGLLVVVLAWFLGPGLFGISSTPVGSTVQAEVVTPAACTGANAGEAVRFSFGGKNRDGMLDGCGHGKGERIDVTVPDGAAETGTIQVTAAETVVGASDLRRPVGLALLVLSCFAGGMYTFLVLRGPRRAVVAA